MGLAFDELSGQVKAAAIEVYKKLGPGFVESVYENALKLELAKRGIPFASQKPIDVLYDGAVVGTHVMDVLVDEGLIVELKAVKALDPVHYSQVRSYLRASGASIGLLMNFNSTVLVVKRIVN